MILIALGANLSSPAGPPEAGLKAALALLEEPGDIRIHALSRIYRSPAWPDPADPEFRNAVACLETMLDPVTLLERLHAVEFMFGRQRTMANAPRPLDLDLLDYDGLLRQEAPQLPHPRLIDRAFVLLPLQDIAPAWRHPVLGHSVDFLIAALAQGLKNGVVPV